MDFESTCLIGGDANPRQRDPDAATAISEQHVAGFAGNGGVAHERCDRGAVRVEQALVDAGFLKVDYFALVDADTLEPLTEPAGEMRLIAAATIGSTRLIDNVRVISATLSPSDM